MRTVLSEDLFTGPTGPGTAYVLNCGWGDSTAGCTCGWSGRRRRLKAAAEQDAWAHSARHGCAVSVPLVNPDRC
ncbi:hypothetical protein [Mycolicibacterium diernhoferi]|uniref:Uncharacterized protein n=1 Tax=Mycolicibacterium diernhoferi TaxID=1801 RepID=A0A1Q4H770_9MYCO|nr:hypothetical protein [Mycolicibacterium diernhoferi]OJZ63368.1 hypothetical protein BRW64_22420 [Mycolicibacterium diernhoferi]OPE54263.1 hypothetical protein BV510_11265 [Mycolicibacterium diernhoferi]PEG54051.1 hypothetical protein CRI78_13270 [Mycolicibacterium diernhoferi]QYL20510.1 hypothetical protein K0O62_15530 [Mycolicibacterium diernhoferi]